MEILSPLTRKRRARVGCWAGLLLLCFGGVLPLPTFSEENREGARQFSEHEVKAAYLMNFIKYVEWPEKVFETNESPFRLGVLGPNPFGDALTQLTQTTEDGQRKVSIEQSDSIADLKNCHLLFFTKSDSGHHTALSELSDLPILSVGEQKDFTVGGGVINFVLIDSKVRFEISSKAAKKRNLKISSRLLKVSHKVYK